MASKETGPREPDQESGSGLINNLQGEEFNDVNSDSINRDAKTENTVAALEQMNTDHTKAVGDTFGSAKAEVVEQKGKDIILPDDEELVKKLMDKLSEYTERQKEKDENDPSKQDDRYKGAVLGRLLSEGSVDQAALLKELQIAYGEKFNEDAFDKAITTIAYHVQTEGANLVKKEIEKSGEESVGEAPTPRQSMQEPREKIGKTYQELKGAKERRTEVSRGGPLAEAEAGPVIDAEIKKLTEAIKAAKEKAAEFLSDSGVIGRDPRRAVESFRNLTENEAGEHRHLARERNEMAYKRERDKGMTVLVGKKAIEEYRQKTIAQAEEMIHEKERSKSVATCWARLSDKDKVRLKGQGSSEFKAHLEQKMKKLSISEDVFAGLVNAGLKPEDAKIRGWLKRLFGFTAVVIPSADGKTSLESDGSKEDINTWVAENPDKKIKERAVAIVDAKISEGKRRLQEVKQTCAKEIIAQAVESYKAEKLVEQPKPVLEPVEDKTKVEKKQRKKQMKKAITQVKKQRKSRKVA